MENGEQGPRGHISTYSISFGSNPVFLKCTLQIAIDADRCPEMFADSLDPCRPGPSPKHLRKKGTFFRSCRGCAAQQHSVGPRCMGTVDV